MASEAFDDAPLVGVRDQVRRFVASTFLVDDFLDGDSFLGTGIVDSLGMMQLVAFVEAEFAIAVADADLVPEHFDSVERVARFVVGRLEPDGRGSARAVSEAASQCRT